MKAKLFITTILAVLFLSTTAYSNVIKPAAKKSLHAAVPYSPAELKKNLLYDFASSSIRNTYDDRLDELAKQAVEKNYAIALRGHADAIGTFKGNWVLSQKRADAVKDYLVKKGVPQNKIVSTAFGSTVPIASNKTAAGRQQNRRVEIKLNNLGK